MYHPVCKLDALDQRFANCVPRDVNKCSVGGSRNQKSCRFYIKFEFSIFDHSLSYCLFKDLYAILSFGY
jgi:hypothetical protein